MSEEREIRILIVDDQRDIARVLKTSLELLNRGFFITDVPSGEEAMLEIQRKEFDLLVTDFRLPGMKGPELIERARKRTAGIKAILISGSPLSEVKAELGKTEVVGIFEKPIDTAAFTESVTKTLLGEQKAQRAMPGTDALGTIPEFDERKINAQLSTLMRDLGCSAVVFVDRTGKVLLREGSLDQSLRFSELAVLLAYNFTTTTEIASYLGDSAPSAVHYYDGDWNDIYAISVGVHFFLTIVFPGGSQKQMGPVLRFGKPVVEEMIGIIGDAALAVPGRQAVEEAEIEMEPEPEPVEEPAPAARKKGSKAAKAEPEQEPLPEPEPAPPPRRKTAPLPALDIDLDSLDAELANAGSDNLDNFWDEAAASTNVLADNTITREEAIELGLISNDEESAGD
jgi:CheY-like chemotaxis protein